MHIRRNAFNNHPAKSGLYDSADRIASLPADGQNVSMEGHVMAILIAILRGISIPMMAMDAFPYITNPAAGDLVLLMH
jgi:hypothetical protein